MPQHDEQQPESPAQLSRIRIIANGAIERELAAVHTRELPARVDEGFTWIDLVKPDEETLDFLRDTYDLHPLIMRRIGDDHQESAVRSFNGSAHVVVHFPLKVQETIRPGEIQVILGENFLISIHKANSIDFEQVIDRWHMTPDRWRSSTGSLLCAMLDVAIADFDPFADRLEDALEQLEEATLDPANRGTPKREAMYKLFDLTEKITDLHDITVPLLDVMKSLMDNDKWLGNEHGVTWSTGVYEEVRRMATRMQMLRETAQRLFEMVNSLITLQRTDVSKQLTIVATIFLPLSFIAAYFGQNFTYMTDGVASRTDYLIWGFGVQVVALAAIFIALWKFGAFR